MKRWIFALLLCVANPLVSAEQFFERAGVTKTINAVSVLPKNKKAAVGDVITKDLALKTGGDSRAELEFPDLTITRVGANAIFRFLAGQRKIILDGGVMLFHAEQGHGGGTVEAGAVTAAVTGTDFLISNTVGRVKVICLDGKVLVFFTANPKSRVGLKPGQMVNIPAGATTMPATVTINLTTLLATSKLGAAGGMGPFPNQAGIEKNARNQTSLQSTSVVGKFFPGLNELLTQTGSQPAQTITTEAAQTARNASRLPPPLPPPTPVPAAITAPVVITAAPAAGGTGGSSGTSGGGTSGTSGGGTGGTSGGGTGGTGGGGTGGTGGAPAPQPTPMRPTPRPIPRPPIVTPRPTPRPPIAPP